MTTKPIVIVSGLPRSGTSMMMQVLEAGGLQVLTDHERKADTDNPKGYYEYEPVKKTRENPGWLENAPGRAVKMVYRLLYDLPDGYEYKVIFMRRDLGEVLASQKKMLERLGKAGGGLEDEKMAELFRSQIKEFEAWAGGKSNLLVLYVNYTDFLDDPPNQARRIEDFLAMPLDTGRMAEVADPSLYRNRK